MKIAVMGYGTIGSGVVDVLRINKEKITKRAGEPVDVKYILPLSISWICVIFREIRWKMPLYMIIRRS